MKRTIGYTGDDLVGIGRAVNKITKRLKAFEADSGSDIEDYIADLRVDVLFEDEIVGYVAFEDGWLGFFPAAVRTDPK